MFVLSKIILMVTDLGIILLALLCVGAILLWTRWRSLGRWITGLALRMPHKFVNDNGINGFLSTQHEPKSYVVKSPESAQYGLWPRWFM